MSSTWGSRSGCEEIPRQKSSGIAVGPNTRLGQLPNRGNCYRYMQRYFNRKERRQARVDLSVGLEPYPWPPRSRVKVGGLVEEGGRVE
jgi:hypothetical protein